jgi:hypothetical protein
MQQFIIRIELHGAKGEDYSKLHSAMGHHGFLRTITGKDGVVYLLPTAEIYSLWRGSNGGESSRGCDSRRSGAWVKFKLARAQEFVIGGYTPPEGSRKYFGALLVGYYGPEGLLFAGRVGTGFSERALETLYDGSEDQAYSGQCWRGSTCPFLQLF